MWILCSVVLYFGLNALLSRRSRRGGGEELPRTDACTLPPKFELAADKFRIFTKEDRMVLQCTCGNQTFADHFAELNESIVLAVEPMIGTVERTARGDIVLKSAKQATVDPP